MQAAVISKGLSLVSPLLLQKAPSPAFTDIFTNILEHSSLYKVIAVALQCILSYLQGYSTDHEWEGRVHCYLVSLLLMSARTENHSLASFLGILIYLQAER